MKHKKIILFLSVICVFAIIIFLQISVNSPKSIDGMNKSWMKDIPDEKKLSEITIPGAHNAAAATIPLSLFSKCQDYSISDLLNAGFRYLDIRAGVDEVDGEKTLFLYHNFILCHTMDGLLPRNLTFADVTATCYDFLASNPSETIIFMVKYEHGDASISEFEWLIEKEIDKNSDKWLLTDKTPCLKQARGKIVLYRRYKDEACLGSKAGIECIWDEQTNTDISDLNHIITTCTENNILVQDMYKLSADDKWTVFSRILNTSPQADNANEYYPTINFLSTTGQEFLGIPRYYATNLNARFMDYALDKEMNPQWIVVDFGDEKLAGRIIQANF